MPKLVNNRVSAEYYIVTYPATLGRHASNTIGLLGSAISRFHAEIGFEAGQHYIDDLGSTYGTYLNGRRVQERSPLFDGDRIVLAITSTRPEGEWDLTFSSEEIPHDSARPIRDELATRPGPASGSLFIEQAEDAVSVKLIGQIRNRECELILKRTMEAVDQTPRDVVLNLGAVTHMNSYALGMLARLWADLRERGLDLTLACAEGRALELIEMVGLSSQLGCHASVADAVEALKDRRQSR